MLVFSDGSILSPSRSDPVSLSPQPSLELPRTPKESSPLLNYFGLQEKPPISDLNPSLPVKAAVRTPPVTVANGPTSDWTAEGLPVADVNVVGDPLRCEQWNSSLLDYLGRNDEFFLQQRSRSLSYY